MNVTDFDYELPAELIARYPLEKRSSSRLLCLDLVTGDCRDTHFSAIVDLLKPGDLLIFNDTKVIPARLYGVKETGGQVEFLVERILDDHHCLAHLRASKTPKAGTTIRVDDYRFTVTGREGDLFALEILQGKSVWACLQDCGHIPLPPYLKREDELSDRERYQTVYAAKEGAVAAPTAGLHFDLPLLSQLQDKGVEFCYLTLHVGAGTFQPIRVENIHDHHMHGEMVELNDQVASSINLAKQRGNRVIAVGTTSVRALESATDSAGITQPFRGETRIFIYPGFKFRCIDAMITNFHLPRSTLMMLVSAYAGHDQLMAAYQHALNQQYRFYSYGDAMYIAKDIHDAV